MPVRPADPSRSRCRPRLALPRRRSPPDRLRTKPYSDHTGLHTSPGHNTHGDRTDDPLRRESGEVGAGVDTDRSDPVPVGDGTGAITAGAPSDESPIAAPGVGTGRPASGPVQRVAGPCAEPGRVGRWPGHVPLLRQRGQEHRPVQPGHLGGRVERPHAVPSGQGAQGGRCGADHRRVDAGAGRPVAGRLPRGDLRPGLVPLAGRRCRRCRRPGAASRRPPGPCGPRGRPSRRLTSCGSSCAGSRTISVCRSGSGTRTTTAATSTSASSAGSLSGVEVAAKTDQRVRPGGQRGEFGPGGGAQVPGQRVARQHPDPGHLPDGAVTHRLGPAGRPADGRAAPRPTASTAAVTSPRRGRGGTAGGSTPARPARTTRSVAQERQRAGQVVRVLADEARPRRRYAGGRSSTPGRAATAGSARAGPTGSGSAP